MARRRKNLPSISTPIIMASIALPIAIALLVGWTLVFAGNLARGDDIATNIWLLVGGVVAFTTLMVQMAMFAIFLGREILEVRRQDSFIDSVTHELKTPLASIKLGLQTLGRPGLDAAKREYLREMMLDDVDRLRRFVDDILQASRLAHDHDRLELQQDEVPLAALVAECAESVCTQHKLAPDAVTVEIDADLVLITDRAALSVVVRNLIDNAVKYSDADAVEVRVRATEARRGLLLEVEDRGIGIPRDDLKRVFHRFYRVSAETVRSRKGTGLGLFVVWALVRSLGGQVEAASDGPGRGTTMRVTLPKPPKTRAA
ncbi:MAG: HAMP domain-containing histidine kinase [Sandaracinaceae bacterium]|nr:HAMP domain-containing histidine kinase [Sandaracinaceae bacterium]